MDRGPGSDPCDSINHYDFSADEIEVATTLTRLNFLITLYDFRKFGFLPPLWGSKRLRSTYRQRTESVVSVACPVISCGGNPRNISPDSPLLLKASATGGGGAQGSTGIVVEPPREKEVTKKHGCKEDVDDSTGKKTSKNTPRKVTRDPSSANDPLPNGGARAHSSPSSPLRASRAMLLFDLNLTPTDCSGIQSPLPDVDRTLGMPPSDGEVEFYGSSKSEATGAAWQERFPDMKGEIPLGYCIGYQGTEPRFRQVQ